MTASGVNGLYPENPSMALAEAAYSSMAWALVSVPATRIWFGAWASTNNTRAAGPALRRGAWGRGCAHPFCKRCWSAVGPAARPGHAPGDLGAGMRPLLLQALLQRRGPGRSPGQCADMSDPLDQTFKAVIGRQHGDGNPRCRQLPKHGRRP